MFRLGIIGCGSVVEAYHLPAAVRCSGVRVTDLVDHDVKRIRDLARSLNLEARSSSDYQDLPQRVDGVIIALPNHLHYSVSRFFLERGIPILCEKPLALRLEEAEELVNLAARQKTLLAVGYVLRFSESTHIVKRILELGSLGELRGFHFELGISDGWKTRSGYELSLEQAGGGVFIVNGIHFLDRMLYWFGKAKGFEYCDDSQGGPEANASATFTFDWKGLELKGKVRLSKTAQLANRLKIIGSKATLEMPEGLTGSVSLRFMEMSDLRLGVDLDGKKQLTRPLDVFQAQLENFVQSVEGTDELRVSGSDSLASLALVESCYKHRGRLVEPWQVHTQSRTKQNVTTCHEPTVLVTGATGFIGGTLCERLCRENGIQVRALVHTAARAARIRRLPLEIVHGDLLSREAVNDAVKGCDTVVHLAGGSTKAFVQGTRNLLEASRRNALRRVVLISSVRVYGPNPSPESVLESTPAQKTGDLYGDAKLQQELLALRFFRRYRLPVVILRAPFVYGPHDKFSTNLISKLKEGKWLSIDGGRGILNAVFVENLVDAICLALIKDNTIGETLSITDDSPITWKQCLADYQRMLRKKVVSIPDLSLSDVEAARRVQKRFLVGELITSTGKYLSSPSWHRRVAKIPMPVGFRRKVMYVFGELLPQIKEILRNDDRFKEIWLGLGHTTGVGDRFLHDDQILSQLRQVVHSCDRARKILGYSPRIDRREGLRCTELWLKDAGYLD